MTAAKPRAPHRTDVLIAGGLFVATFLVLLWTEKSVGFVRDESVYFAAADRFAQWWQLLWSRPGQALSDAAITDAFAFNREHPMAMKSLFGLSRLLFHDVLNWVRPATAYRLPAFALAALIPALLHLFGSSLYSRRAGLFAGLSFFLIPRHFFDAHLAAFDVPISTMWLAVVYLYWRSQTDARYWLYTGVCFGLAIATKHNGFFLPFVIVPFALYRTWQLTRTDAPARQTFAHFVTLYAGVLVLLGVLIASLGLEGFEKSFEPLSPASGVLLVFAVGTGVLLRRLARQNVDAFRALAPVGAMAVLGPILFVAHWPFLWYHPVERIAWYLNFHASHEHYAWMYLGMLLRQPPFPLEYVVRVTALTVPLSLLVPMGLGMLRLLVQTVRGLVSRASTRLPPQSDVLLGMNALASICIISWPTVPHFGGVKHWIPSMCFLAILSGTVVARAADTLAARLPPLTARLKTWGPFAALSALLFLPALIDTVRIHPYGTSFYAELSGGVPGAASLGMQRQYWSSNVTGVLPWINTHAPPNARIYLHEVRFESFVDYQRNGMLREDLRPARGGSLAAQISDANIVAYQYHQEFREQEMNVWDIFGTQVPAFGLYVDETPQVLVYQRRP